MQAVAYNESESSSRRAEAAWQCSIFNLMAAQVSDVCSNNPHMDSTLSLLLLAANLGNWKAQSICGWFHDLFGRSLPVGEDVEVQWLHDATCKGSTTARRRLQHLNFDAYVTAVDELKRCFGGIGVELPREWNTYSDEDFLMLIEYQQRDIGNFLQLAATCGRLSLINTIFEKYSSDVDINFRFPGDETVLLKACRSGHFHVVLTLLDHGADASLSSEEGATPLHFLSAFDENKIPCIADRLMAAGASLEARSNNAQLFKTTTESLFGMVDGTPLTWAVSANNLTAVHALLDLGSDPFDVAGRTATYSDGWSNNSHVSPAWTAAANFQHEILEALLKKADNCAEKLNYNERCFGESQELKDPYTLLGWVVNGCDGHSIRRLLLHGKQYSYAFQRTFDLCLKFGADPKSVNREKLPVIRPAIQWGQPYILEYLMTTQDGRFKPDKSEWLHGVVVALALQDNATLDILLKYSREDELGPDDWSRFFATTKSLPDDVKVLDRFRKYRDPNMDFFPHFGNALLAGKYELAKFLYQTGKCDLMTMDDGRSLLGRLIISSKVYRNASLHVAAFLRLNPPEEVYYNVMDLMGSKLTALQAVVYIQEYREGHKATTDILQAILRKKSDPEFLNRQVESGPWQGKTALYLAVESCNLDAVQYLIDTKSRQLDFSTLDSNGLSLMDQAALLMRNQKKNLELWEVPSEKWRDADLKHFENATVIARLLYRTKKAKPNRVLLSVSRIDTDDIQAILYGQNEQLVIPCKISGKYT